MVKSDYEKNHINIFLPGNDELPVNLLAGIFKDKNQSYKLFWFQAILDSICEGKIEISYDDLICKMFAESWFMVMEYHLNLGPADSLEILINKVREKSGFSKK